MKLKSQESSLIVIGDAAQGFLHLFFGARDEGFFVLERHQALYILKRMLANEVV